MIYTNLGKKLDKCIPGGSSTVSRVIEKTIQLGENNGVAIVYSNNIDTIEDLEAFVNNSYKSISNKTGKSIDECHNEFLVLYNKK